MGWSIDSRTSPKRRLGLYLARFQTTAPQLSTAGPSFLFHLPAARLLTNNYRNRASCSGFPAPEELPQQPGNAFSASVRGGRAGTLPRHLHGCGLLAATLSAEKNKRGSSYSGLWVFPHAAHTPQVTGL